MTVSYTDKSAVREVIQHYFEAINNNDNGALVSAVADKMYTQSTNFMEKLHQENQRVAFAVQGGINVTKAPSPTEQFVFIAKYAVSGELTPASGEPTNTVYNAVSTISSDFHILTMKMSKAVNN